MRSILITSSILILLLAALRPLLRGRIDPRVQYALWLIAALRLLLPLELAPSAYSALALLDRAEGPAQAAQAIGQTAVPLPMSYEDAFDLALQEYQRDSTVTTSFTDLDRVDARAQELLEQGPTLDHLFERYARPVWLGGAALAGLWFLLVDLRFRRRLRAAEPVAADPSIRLPVYVSDALPSPCLYGTLRPAIYVTPHTLQDPDRLRHVLAHESTHCRHRDHWWGLVRCLCLCLYWFDPLVWWAAALSRQDCELACDAGAIRRLGEEERIPYGRTLVDMIAAGRCSLMQTATTMTGGRRRVRERVRLIARRPKTVLAVVLALVLVLGAAVGCTFTGAPERSDPTSDDLQARLMDLPEELQDTVTTVTGNGSLVEYRLYVPADWEDEHYAYVLSVRSFQKEGFHAFPESGEDILWEIAAQDDTHYYAIHRLREQTYPSEYEYWDTHRAVRAFVKETLLATEGLEPYAQPLDTLQQRLLDVPEELRDHVEARAENDALAIYYFKKPGEALNKDQYLLILDQFSQERFDELFDGSPSISGGSHVFARGDGQYYVLYRNTSIEYDLEDEEAFNAAYRAVSDFAQKTVLETEGVELFDLYQLERYQVAAVVNQLLAAPSVELTLAPAGSSRVYAYPIDPSQDQNFHYLSALASNFRWEEAPPSSFPEGTGTLRVSTPDGLASLTLKDGSYLVMGADGNCWKGTYGMEDYVATAGTTPFDYLRRLLFDEVELSYLRTTTVPDRGQSHEVIAREWAENWEGAMSNTAPGSQYARTLVRIENVRVDLPEFTDREALEEFVKNRNFSVSAEDFGKIWFGFSYDTVFVPVDQSDVGPLWAGNTRYYEGDDAPEGAVVYSHVGYLFLTDEGWTCTGVGTGW